MSDIENSGDLETLKIDRQLAALRREIKELNIGPSRTETKENGKSARRVAEALVIAALIGVGATVWMLRDAVNILQTSQAFMQKQIDKVDSRQDRTDDRVNEMSGRQLRGIADGKDPYATDK